MKNINLKKSYGLAALAFFGSLSLCSAQESWQDLSAPFSVELQNVHFTDANHGWAVGQSGTLIQTSDAGATWHEQDHNYSSNWINNVYFVDANHGWVVGDDGRVMHTTDAGKNWQEQETGTTSWLNDVFFVDQKTGWFTGWNGDVYRTDDGGENWNKQNTPTTLHLETIYFTDKNHGVIAGWDGIILHTNDGGATWNKQITSKSDHLEMVWFIDKNVGWISGKDGRVLKTTDGGQTWKSQNTNTKKEIEGIQFIDHQRGWAAGDDGMILSTTDGGANWKMLESGVELHLRDLFIQDDNIWIIGIHGTVLTAKVDEELVVEEEEQTLEVIEVEPIFREPYPAEEQAILVDLVEVTETLQNQSLPQSPVEVIPDPVEEEVSPETKEDVSSTPIELNGITVFPNPNQGLFSVELNLAKEGSAQIEVLDINGRQMVQKQMQVTAGQQIALDLGNTSAGIYFVKVSQGEALFVEKVVVK